MRARKTAYRPSRGRPGPLQKTGNEKQSRQNRGIRRLSLGKGDGGQTFVTCYLGRSVNQPEWNANCFVRRSRPCRCSISPEQAKDHEGHAGRLGRQHEFSATATTTERPGRSDATSWQSRLVFCWAVVAGAGLLSAGLLTRLTANVDTQASCVSVPPSRLRRQTPPRAGAITTRKMAAYRRRLRTRDQEIGLNGRMDVAYFNQNPIRCPEPRHRGRIP